MTTAPTLNLALHPVQTEAFLSPATEILYGGSAGGGKSHLMRIASIIWCCEIPGLQIYLFRRISDDLVKNHMEGPNGYRAILAPLVHSGHVRIVEDEIRFWTGAKIYLCHCKDEKDRFKYQGAEIHVLMIDELTHFTDVIYRFLRSRVRMPDTHIDTIPEKYRHQFPRILCSSNPGGIGHQFVKQAWIDCARPMQVWRTSSEEGGFLRQFIPAHLSDNPSLNQTAYTQTLSGLGNDALVRAMLEGDWDVVSGAALDITRDRHLLRAFKPLKHWTKFMAMDWGYVKPYSVGWFCVPDEDFILAEKNGYQEKLVPANSIILYRELYGSTGKANEGSREESDIVAKRIVQIERDADEKMDYRVCDTAMWAKTDGPSMIERMYKATDGAFNPRQSIKDRQSNYSEFCSRLRGFEFSKDIFVPMFYATENCLNFWRTVPSLVLDSISPEKGPDTNQEDHSFDSTIYGIMSRPMAHTEGGRIRSEFFSKRAKHMKENRDPYRIKTKGKK